MGNGKTPPPPTSLLLACSNVCDRPKQENGRNIYKFWTCGVRFSSCTERGACLCMHGSCMCIHSEESNFVFFLAHEGFMMT